MVIEFFLSIFGIIVMGLAAIVMAISISGIAILIRGVVVCWDVVLKEALPSGNDSIITGLTYEQANNIVDNLRAYNSPLPEGVKEACTGISMRPRLAWSYEKVRRAGPF